MSERRTYTKVCKRCGSDYQSYRNTRRPGTCADMACLKAEADEHNAAVAAWEANRPPRRPRRRRTPQPLYGDYAQLAALNGISTDGTGRKQR